MNTKENNSSPELLVKLLDEEINRLDNSSKRSGVTPWILLATISGIIWIIFPELEKYTSNYTSLLLPLLLVSITYDLIILLVAIISLKGGETTNPNSNFQLANIKFGENRVKILYETIRLLVVLLLIAYCYTNYSHNIILYLFPTYIIFFLILIGSFLLSFFPIPFSTEGNRKYKFYGQCTIILITTSLFIGTLGVLQTVIHNQVDIHTWKLSSLLFAISIILGLLAKQGPNQSPFLNSLINIRRDFILNKITDNEAVKQIDIIFSGLSISTILQKDIDNLLSKERHITSILNSMAKEYETVKRAAQNDLENKCILCASLVRSTEGQLNEVKEYLNYYQQDYVVFNRRVKMLIQMASSTKSLLELKAVYEKIDAIQDQLNLSTKTATNKIGSFRTDLNCDSETKQIEKC